MAYKKNAPGVGTGSVEVLAGGLNYSQSIGCSYAIPVSAAAGVSNRHTSPVDQIAADPEQVL